jgi:hypothetical protein
MEEFSLKIERVNNGYILYMPDYIEDEHGEIVEIINKRIIQDDDVDELKSYEELLWNVMEYFGFGGSKHDLERIRIIREKKEE